MLDLETCLVTALNISSTELLVVWTDLLSLVHLTQPLIANPAQLRVLVSMAIVAANQSTAPSITAFVSALHQLQAGQALLFVQQLAGLIPGLQSSLFQSFLSNLLAQVHPHTGSMSIYIYIYIYIYCLLRLSR
jgi:hypothetical protein